ncbi:MAG: 2-oxoglutarate oxidoreductase [Clostridiales Family XIII bacterium]|jgi:2-oxoglutarate ferredoxin oxidoreductase subunit beta|nr:2-oxoglutarate oxidoreductase [Clostridiales Family XIII bacterium]
MTTRKKPEVWKKDSSFCPGCGHGIVIRLIAELIEEMGVKSRELHAVGCACNLNGCWNDPQLQCPHGRAAAVAVGAKACEPDDLVFTYQGDGDAYVIGLSETMNAGYRGNITSIIINNNNFGMTGGQMSWTTLPGQTTTTSKKGRDALKEGEPFKGPELLSQFENVKFAARGAVYNPAEVNKTKALIKKAFELQMSGEGYGVVEVLCGCPTNWKMSPVDSNKWIEDAVTRYYGLGIIKDETAKILKEAI